MMTAEQLLGSIFERALQGKLVEQKVSEGTGEDLFQKIQAEKQRLIKSGKLKKTKLVEPITEDEIPFDIPVTWKWVRVESIVTLNPKNELADDIETAFIPMTLVDDGYSNHHTFEVRKWGEIKKGFSHFANGDIGVAKITPCFQNRKSVIFRNLINGFGAGTTELTIVRPFTDSCCREYLLAVFKSESFIKSGMKSFTGTAGQQRIHKDFLRTYVMPLPPLEEQKRIVAKIEELMPFVEQYAKASTRLNTLNASFPDQMKKSILQQAVMGKLVPQDPNDEPASVLLKKIAEEKKKLIKEGKIKKQKTLPAITEDEIPFDIPESWEWVRWGTIAQSIQYGFNAPAQETGRIKMVRISDIQNNQVQWETVPYCEIDEKEISNYLLEENDILFARTGGTVGKSFLVKGIEQEAIYAGYLIRTRYSQRLCPDYLKLFMESDLYWRQLRNGTIATAQPNCNGQTLSKMLIPIPPAEEQNRIASEVQKYSLSVKELHAKAN